METDELWPGGPAFISDNGAFRLSTDSVLLASFAMAGRAKHAAGRCTSGSGRRTSGSGRRTSGSGRRTSACDLGCGAGIISVLLAWHDPALVVDGIELQPEWADIARENTRLCRLDSRINIISSDLRCHRTNLKAGAYDLVVSNPPYYPAGSGKSSDNENTATAREERMCTIGDVCAAAAYLTRWGGRFALVHKPERLAEIICTLRENGLEPKRLRFVQYKAVSAPSLVLIESRRGGKPSLTIEPPLILTDEAGNDTDEVKRIYHRG